MCFVVYLLFICSFNWEMEFFYLCIRLFLLLILWTLQIICSFKWEMNSFSLLLEFFLFQIPSILNFFFMIVLFWICIVFGVLNCSAGEEKYSVSSSHVCLAMTTWVLIVLVYFFLFLQRCFSMLDFCNYLSLFS